VAVRVDEGRGVRLGVAIRIGRGVRLGTGDAVFDGVMVAVGETVGEADGVLVEVGVGEYVGLWVAVGEGTGVSEGRGWKAVGVAVGGAASCGGVMGAASVGCPAMISDPVKEVATSFIPEAIAPR
jgi:hypothetical protein